MVEQSNSREEQANQTIEKLQAEVGQMSALVQKHAALLGGDTTIEELISARDTFAIKLRDAEQQIADQKDRAESLVKELNSKNERYR